MIPEAARGFPNNGFRMDEIVTCIARRRILFYNAAPPERGVAEYRRSHRVRASANIPVGP